MAKLIGTKKINLAVFISGAGSNLKNLIKHSLKKILNSVFVSFYQTIQKQKALIMRNNIKFIIK